jgi:hypothetical protein
VHCPDGNRLAIRTQDTDTYENSIYSVKVYELELDYWKMIGNISDYSPDANYNYLHYAVFSGNGQVLVIIKIKSTSISNTNGAYDAKLSYTTHKWNSTIGSSSIGSWDVMEDKGGLLSKTHKNQFASLNLERCFALSDDGTVLGVCSKLGIAVYSWNLDKSSWIPRDVIIDPNNLASLSTV